MLGKPIFARKDLTVWETASPMQIRAHTYSGRDAARSCFQLGPEESLRPKKNEFTKSVCRSGELLGILRIHVLECAKQIASEHAQARPRLELDRLHDQASRIWPWNICQLFAEQQFGHCRMRLFVAIFICSQVPGTGGAEVTFDSCQDRFWR